MRAFGQQMISGKQRRHNRSFDADAQAHSCTLRTRLLRAGQVQRSLISGTPCCMLHFGIEWESVWYPNVLGRTFGEEIGVACGVSAQKVPPILTFPRQGGRNTFFELLLLAGFRLAPATRAWPE